MLNCQASFLLGVSNYFFLNKKFLFHRAKDDEEADIGDGPAFKRSLPGSVGASLRASTRGELGSSMLQRSLRLRQSTNSMKNGSNHV